MASRLQVPPVSWKSPFGSVLPGAGKASRPSKGFSFTFGGVIFTGFSLVVALAALNNRSNLLFLLFCIAFGGLVISFLFSDWSVSRVAVERQLPPVALAGRPFVLTYRLTNLGRRWRVFSIAVTDHLRSNGLAVPVRAYQPCLDAGRTVTLAVPTVFPRRGLASFSPITLESRFPFGIVRRYRTFPAPDALMVLPALLELRPQSPRDRVSTAVGRIPRTVQWLHGEDIAGLREYRQGDNPKWIYWRKSARTGDLFIYEKRHPTPHRLVLVMDLRLTGPPEHQSPLLELVISAAATLGCDALERGCLVGLVAVARDLIVLPPIAGREQRDRLMHQLADLRYAPDGSLEPALRSVRFQERWRGSACLLSPAAPESLRLVAGWIARQIGPVEILSPSAPAFHERFVLTGPASDDQEQSRP